MGDVTELHPKGPWIVVCPECGCTKFHLYENPNIVICADEDCAEVMDLRWFEEEGAA